jgi:hypothetical protein
MLYMLKIDGRELDLLVTRVEILSVLHQSFEIICLKNTIITVKQEIYEYIFSTRIASLQHYKDKR